MHPTSPWHVPWNDVTQLCAGKVELVNFDTLTFTSVALPNPAAVSPNGRGGRTQSVTDMALVDGRLVVAGLSNEEFSNEFEYLVVNDPPAALWKDGSEFK